jgi:hypothetical protein
VHETPQYTQDPNIKLDVRLTAQAKTCNQALGFRHQIVQRAHAWVQTAEAESMLGLLAAMVIIRGIEEDYILLVVGTSL